MKAPYSALYKVLEGRLIRPFERGPVKKPFKKEPYRALQRGHLTGLLGALLRTLERTLFKAF